MGRNFALLTPQIDEAEALYAAGHSMRSLAAIFEVSETAIKSAMKLRNVHIRSHREQAHQSALTVETLRLNCIVLPSGCWIWQGTPSKKTGFCSTWHTGERDYIHRIAYKLHTGERLRKGQFVLQDCGNKMCVGPDCLIRAHKTHPLFLERIYHGQQRHLARQIPATGPF